MTAMPWRIPCSWPGNAFPSAALFLMPKSTALNPARLRLHQAFAANTAKKLSKKLGNAKISGPRTQACSCATTPHVRNSPTRRNSITAQPHMIALSDVAVLCADGGAVPVAVGDRQLDCDC